jgi:hypothetical protein
MDADGDIKNAYTPAQPTREWFLGVWYLGQAAPFAREKLVATLAAETTVALG